MDAASDVARTWAVFIVVCISGSLLGRLFPRVGLPLITGFLVVGAACGPYALDIVHKKDLPRLGLITQMALSYIAYSAGAELYLPELRALIKSIVAQTFGITLSVLIICTAAISALAATGAIGFMKDLSTPCSVSAAAVASVILITSSPAAAIAVVKEMRAKGVFTSTILGITVLADVVVLLCFSLTTTAAEEECKGGGFDGISLAIMIGVLFGSLAIGYLFGFLLIALISFKRLPTRHLILPLGLGIFVFSHWFTEYTHEHFRYVINLEPLLMCIAAGYVCTNKSKNRHRFISLLQTASPFIFLPFFTLTGASLDLQVLAASIAVAVIIVVIRACALFVGAAAGGWLAGQSNLYNTHSFLTQVVQAGVSLGLAGEVGMAFPGWGRQFQTLIISIVIVNQVLGPFLFKVALRRVGEANQAGGEGEVDPDAIVPTAVVVGYSPTNMALCAKLLKARWHVTLVTGTEAEAASATAAVATYGAAVRENKGRNKTVVQKVVNAAMKKPVGMLKATIQKLEDKAVAIGNEAAAAEEAARKKTAEEKAAAGGHGHEHEEAPLESGFHAVALVPGANVTTLSWDDVDALLPAEEAAAAPAPTNAASSASGSGEAPATPNGGAAGPSGRDWRFARLVPLILGPEGKTLQAFIAALPTDAATYAAIEIAAATISRAPRRSHLHSVRLVAEVQGPAWVQPLGALGAVVTQRDLSSVRVLSALATASLSKPVVVQPASATNDDLSKAAGDAFEGPHFWSWLEEAAEHQQSLLHGVGGAIVGRTSSGRSSSLARRRGASFASHNSDHAVHVGSASPSMGAAAAHGGASTGAGAMPPPLNLPRNTSTGADSATGGAGGVGLSRTRSMRSNSSVGPDGAQLPRTLSRVIPASALVAAAATGAGSGTPVSTGSAGSRGMAAAAARALRLDAAISALAPGLASLTTAPEVVPEWQRDEYLQRLSAMQQSSSIGSDLPMFAGAHAVQEDMMDALGGYGTTSVLGGLSTIPEDQDSAALRREAAARRAGGRHRDEDSPEVDEERDKRHAQAAADRLVAGGMAAAAVAEAEAAAAVETDADFDAAANPFDEDGEVEDAWAHQGAQQTSSSITVNVDR